MSKYTKNLNPLPYENGFRDKPEKTTISASILNNWFSVLGRLEDWLYQHDILDISPNKVPAGEPSTQLNNLYVDGTIYTVSGGGGALDDLTNVDITSPQEGDALVYDSTNQEWINGTVSSVDDLDDLSNVDIVNVVNGQALCYNGVTSKWENKTVSGGGGIDSSIIADDYDSTHYNYQKDEFVICNDILYKCLCDISGEAGDFDPACWESVQIVDTIIPTIIYNPTDGQVLTYDSSSGVWVNENSGGGSANIWTGTQAEYNAQASQIADGTLVNITDDEEEIAIAESENF